MTVETSVDKEKLPLENKQLLDELRAKEEEIDQLNQYIELKDEQIARLHKMYIDIVLSLDLDKKFELITHIARELFQAEITSLMLIDRKTGKLKIASAKGLDDKVIKEATVEIGEGIAGLVAKEKRPILVNNVEKDPRFKRSNRPHYKTKSFMSSPLMFEDEVIGILNCADKTNGESFQEEDLSLLSMVSSYLTSVLHNAKLFEELALSNKRLKTLSNFDELTNAYNRRYLYERLNKELERAKRYQHPLSILMIDLDHFKSVNDKYGHQFGDFVLKEMVKQFKEAVRNVDIVTRYGGEEFTIILPDTNIEGARIAAERIRARIQAHTFASDPHLEKMTISVGIASLGVDDITTAEQLMKNADNKLYQAKTQGRNCVVW